MVMKRDWLYTAWQSGAGIETIQKAGYDNIWTFVLSGARRAYKIQNREARTKKVFGIGFHKTATARTASKAWATRW